MMLAEAEIIRLIPANEANPMDYDVVFGNTPLCHPEERIRYCRSALAQLQRQLPSLSESGLCKACKSVTVSDLQTAEGYTPFRQLVAHFSPYVAVLGSQEAHLL